MPMSSPYIPTVLLRESITHSFFLKNRFRSSMYSRWWISCPDFILFYFIMFRVTQTVKATVHLLGIKHTSLGSLRGLLYLRVVHQSSLIPAQFFEFSGRSCGAAPLSVCTSVALNHRLSSS